MLSLELKVKLAWLGFITQASDCCCFVFQELPKYLRGFHVCTKEEMANLAALLFRIKFSGDKSQFVMIPKMLKELVPADQLKTLSENEWKKVKVSFISFISSSVSCVTPSQGDSLFPPEGNSDELGLRPRNINILQQTCPPRTETTRIRNMFIFLVMSPERHHKKYKRLRVNMC